MFLIITVLLIFAIILINAILDSSFYIQEYINSTYSNKKQDTTYSIKFIDTHNENN